MKLKATFLKTTRYVQHLGGKCAPVTRDGCKLVFLGRKKILFQFDSHDA